MCGSKFIIELLKTGPREAQTRVAYSSASDFLVRLLNRQGVHSVNMKSQGNTFSSQSGFFAESGELGGSHPQFAEICTALYERELIALSVSTLGNASLLKRRMGGLPHHVRSVARYMVAVQNSGNLSPLDIDTHNGSWFAKQASTCPGVKHDNEKCAQWYERHADYGLVVPVLISSIEGFTIELDSIDIIDEETQRLHLNKYGWFTKAGKFIEAGDDKPFQRHLLKPSKAIMVSASCGHCWTHKSRTFPRALSIREMRLSTQINWKDYKSSKQK